MNVFLFTLMKQQGKISFADFQGKSKKPFGIPVVSKISVTVIIIVTI